MHGRLRETLAALGALSATTAALVAIRASLDTTHVALAYLLVVLAISSRAGHAVGLGSAVVAFLAFNFFFLLPYYTLTIADPRDWTVLAVFLASTLIAAQLLARARTEAVAARQRAEEVARLSALGAETLNAARAENALQAIAEVIRSTVGATSCSIHVSNGSDTATLPAARAGPVTADVHRDFGQPATDRLVQWVAEHGRIAAELHSGSVRFGDERSGADRALLANGDLRTLVLPLRVRDETVGVLSLRREDTAPVDPARERFLEALSYYAALGVERLRSAREADQAEALRRADEAKNAVLASVSHDLRTPLTTIKAMAHEISQSGDDRALTIEEEADRLNRFVADLLDLSRITAGALRVEAVVNAAEDLIGAALQRVSGSLADRELVAELDPSEPLLLGRFDFSHALRILSNLIENALKFAPPRSTVEVRARRVTADLEFVVADRGPGVPSLERDAIFAPFHRRGTQDATGVGLGLAIARGLAEAQGGSVRYEPREGGGSLFILTVPAADVTELEVDQQVSL